MKLLNIMRNIMMYALIIGCILAIFCFGKEKGDIFVHLVTGNYPMDGDYWITFSSENRTVFADIIYQQNIYENEPVNMSNLELLADGNKCNKISKDEINSDEELRIYLLENGLAYIVNEGEATENEMSAQKRAQKGRYGLWGYGTNSQSGIYAWVGKFLEPIRTNIWKGVLILFALTFGPDKIIAIGKMFARKKKVDVIFFGAEGTGKTSIITRLHNPNMTEEEFKEETNYMIAAKNYKELSRIPCGKHYIYFSTCDGRDDSYSGMQDSVLFSNAVKIVIVYVIGLEDAADQTGADTRGIENQLIQASVACDTLRNCSAFKNRVNKIILFVNKCDLLAETETMLKGKSGWIRGIISTATEERTNLGHKYKNGRLFDNILYGSALKNWSIWKLQKEIEEGQV